MPSNDLLSEVFDFELWIGHVTQLAARFTLRFNSITILAKLIKLRLRRNFLVATVIPSGYW